MCKKDVYFYVNGLPRLIMACAIADEYYPNHRKHLILLHQHGYNYSSVLPHVQDKFTEVFHVSQSVSKYSIWQRFFHVYLNPHLKLRRFFAPDSEVVLFHICTPIQKFIIRYNRSLGSRITVYAESFAVNRCFFPPEDGRIIARAARAVFPRVFDFQHDYDAFYVMAKQIYADTPYIRKLKSIEGLYKSRAFLYYSELLTSHIQLADLAGYDTVFFGQPLSNFDDVMSEREEIDILRFILKDRKVLIFPHPNEVLKEENKYSEFKNAKVFRSGVPNELLLLLIRPKYTITYFSSIGINYAAMNPDSENCFYPTDKSKLNTLKKYAQYLPNIKVKENFSGIG